MSVPTKVVAVPEPLFLLHKPGEADDCELCTRRTTTKPLLASVVGKIIRRPKRNADGVMVTPSVQLIDQSNVTHVEAYEEEDVTVSPTVRDEEAWKEDIWHSYGTREYQFPSSSSTASSPSSDDWPWGADSPTEPLEPGAYGFKWYPYFLDDNGNALKKGSTEWHRRVED
jgi:hypothetical protein